MNKKFYITLALFLLVIASLISAGNQTLEYSYDFFTNTPIEKTIDFSSFLLRFNTVSDATCKYSSEVQGVSYVGMTGSFDLSGGKVHEKSFTELGDGVYNYYVKCDSSVLNGSEPAEFHLDLRVDSLVTAQVVPSESAPLRAGKIGLSLLTSKFLSSTPSLKYSFDGIVYNEIPLYGSEKLWNGYLIIPQSIKEGIVSFRFTGNDLQGRQGTEITSGNVFLIDTQKPLIIVDIITISSDEEVRLEWYDNDEEDIEEYRIYRDDSPGVDYTDFYTTTDNDFYEDKSVEEGKTYYYKITAVDEAGNEGDLSFEVSSTVLKGNTIISETGLDPELIGRVENFIVEVDSILLDIRDIKDSIDSKNDLEKNLFNDLGFGSKVDQTILELNNLNKDAERFKLQDLKESELTDKINALRVRLNVAKKKVPEDINIIEEKSVVNSFDEIETERTLLEYNSSLLPKDVSKILKESFDFLTTSEIKVSSDYYLAKILYLEGSTEDISIVSRDISGDVERMDNSYFIESIPKNVAEDVSEINFVTSSYTVLKEDPIVGFDTDTKRILYFFQDKKGISLLEDSSLVFVKFPEEKEKVSLTGFFLREFDESLGYGGVFLGILIMGILASYLFFLRQTNLSDKGKEIFEMIKKTDNHLQKGNRKTALGHYTLLKHKYKLLEKKDKKILYRLINEIYSKINNKNQEKRN